MLRTASDVGFSCCRISVCQLSEHFCSLWITNSYSFIHGVSDVFMYCYPVCVVLCWTPEKEKKTFMLLSVRLEIQTGDGDLVLFFFCFFSIEMKYLAFETNRCQMMDQMMLLFKSTAGLKKQGTFIPGILQVLETSADKLKVKASLYSYSKT